MGSVVAEENASELGIVKVQAGVEEIGKVEEPGVESVGGGESGWHDVHWV